jgi:glycosyltransferase involved in cell wall biosynthesis
LNGRSRWAVDFVARRFDAATAREVRLGDAAVYCYEDSAELTFERAHELGVRCVYELPIMHYRAMREVFRRECERVEGLSLFFETLHEPEWKLRAKDEELRTADLILVASGVVKRSIEDYYPVKAPIRVVPYGADLAVAIKATAGPLPSGRALDRPLRLFHGGILGPRKGVHVLLEALQGLPASSYELRLAGRWAPGFDDWVKSRFAVKFEWIGQISHPQMYEECRHADVFVFPSLAEGFGMVILEAMASGTPVISTEATAGPELYTHGREGMLCRAGDPESLREQIAWCLEHRGELYEMGLGARKKAEAWSWARYRETLRRVVLGAIDT